MAILFFRALSVIGIKVRSTVSQKSHARFSNGQNRDIKKINLLSLLAILTLLGACKTEQKNNSKPLPVNESFSLENVIDEKSSLPFACSFGHFKVEIVPSKYKEHKYFKMHGSGILLNSAYLSTNVRSHPEIIYAVPNVTPIENGSYLTALCIADKNIPYEGKERAKIDQAAALVEFYR